MIRLIFFAVLIVLAGSVVWNVTGPVVVTGLDAEYYGRVVEGPARGKALSLGGCELVKEWIENRTRPSTNALRILWQQLWYNAVTEGYESQYWIEPREYRSGGPLYAFYISGNTVFMRLEYSGKNRVLEAEFTAEELAEALYPYLEE